jgi:hypothetical protein
MVSGTILVTYSGKPLQQKGHETFPFDCHFRQVSMLQEGHL